MKKIKLILFACFSALCLMVVVLPAQASSASRLCESPKKWNVYFYYDGTFIDHQPSVIISLQNLSKAKHCMFTITEFHGYTDTTGSKAYNMDLSYRRALSFQKYLQEQGYPSKDAKIIAHGEDDLFIPIEDGVKEQLNRRAVVVIEIIDLTKSPQH